MSTAMQPVPHSGLSREQIDLVKRTIAKGATDDELALFIQRFWDRVEKSPTCWFWGGAVGDNGYGRLRACGKTWLAHRVAMLLSSGHLAPLYDHLCRVRHCVNPAHLEAVSKSINAKRGIPGQLATHCKRGHKMTDASVYVYQRGDKTLRQCKACFAVRRAS